MRSAEAILGQRRPGLRPSGVAPLGQPLRHSARPPNTRPEPDSASDQRRHVVSGAEPEIRYAVSLSQECYSLARMTRWPESPCVYGMAASGFSRWPDGRKRATYIFTEYGVAIDVKLNFSRATLLMVSSEFQPTWLERGL